MIKISRFSNDGFCSQEQSHHFKYMEVYYDNKLYYELLQNMITHYIKFYNMKESYEIEYITNKITYKFEQKRNFCLDHLEDFKRGIWVFWKGCEDNVELNHFKNGFPAFNIAELPEDTECYDFNLESLGILSDSIMSTGTYIPERELYKLQNIRLNIKAPYIVPYQEYWKDLYDTL